ncbi:MAG: hypothetical protein HFG03_08915 [Oscillibacter sp.]|nr:hypothetical protein [Oscillibacter sp.]
MKHRLLTLIFTICILSLAACGGETLPAKEPDPPQPAETPAEPVSPEESPAEDAQPETLPPLVGTPLTEEELAQVNGAFDYSQPGEADQEKKLERSCFFTSSYEDVTELNLEEFLRYYSNGSSTLEDEDAEEFQALAALPDFPYDAEALETWENRPGGLPVPVHRIPREAVDQTLETYAGITTADLKNTKGILYLPDYDSYYNFTSDFGPGWFAAAEGARDGDTVRLRSEVSWWGDGGETVRELTLREKDGRWLIQSFTVLPTGSD